MTYYPLKDYISKRCEEETAARGRVRANAVTGYYAFIASGDASFLCFGTVKRWYESRYLSLTQIRNLVNKGVLTEEEYTEITHRATVELPIEDFAFTDGGRVTPMIAEVDV